MTEQEAIKKIRNCLDTNNLIMPYSDEMDAFGMAIAALEKMSKFNQMCNKLESYGVPREYIQIVLKSKNGVWPDDDGFAPDGSFYVRWLNHHCRNRCDEHDYCPNCGQKIDWSDMK